MVKISIGLPVYNEENTIHRVVDSILNQTHSDFELIISDNASTDDTSNICKEYAKKDKRIQYFRQSENMGIHYNFTFVLENASYDYFVWIGADDFWEKENLEENLNVLLRNEKIVCSIGMPDFLDNHDIKDKSSQILDKLRSKYLNEKYESLLGNYEEKVKKYLKNSMCEIFYGFHRTAVLRKSLVTDKFAASDWATNLNILKLGDVNVINKKLWHKSLTGISSKGMNKTLDILHKGQISRIFPYYKFSIWCIRNLGIRIFLKNLNYFILLNMSGTISLIFSLFNRINKN